jgi:hypothetical protein
MQSRSSNHVCSHRILSKIMARGNPRLFYFPIEKYTPTYSLLLCDPPSLTYRRIKNHSFASSLLIIGLSNPQDSLALVNAEFLSPYQDFCSITISQLAMSNTSPYQLPTHDMPKLQHTRELSLRVPVTSIGISDFAGSRIQISMGQHFSS